MAELGKLPVKMTLQAPQKEDSLNIKWKKQALARLKTLSNRKNDPLYNPATKSNVNPQNEEVQNLIIFFEVMQNYNLNFAIKKFLNFTIINLITGTT